MPLHNFIWDTKVSVKDGVPIIAGTAKNEKGEVVEVAVTVEALRKLKEKGNEH